MPSSTAYNRQYPSHHRPRLPAYNFEGDARSSDQGVTFGHREATERASMYLSEGEGVRNQRKELMLKKDRLDGVLRALFQFGM